MRQTILVIGFILFGSYLFSASGQAKKFEIGILGGPGLATIYGNSFSKDAFKPILTGYAGILFQYHFSNHFSTKTGLTYERKGTKFKLDSWEFQSGYTYHFDYLTVPFVIQAEFGKKVCFYINAGPYFSYLFRQEYTGKNSRSGAGNWLIISSSVNKNQNIFDIGISAEIGTKIEVSKEWTISIGLMENYGLVNTDKQLLFTTPTLSPVNSDKTSYNHAIFLALGFSYKLDEK
jgi:hypothetical protein